MGPVPRTVPSVVGLLLSTMLFPSAARADNPIVQSIYLAAPRRSSTTAASNCTARDGGEGEIRPASCFDPQFGMGVALPQ